MLNLFCLIVSLVAVVGSVQQIVNSWSTYCFFCEVRPFGWSSLGLFCV